MARDISAFQGELDRDAKRSERRRSGGGGDIQWFTPSKPAKTGDATRTRLRILPRVDQNGEYRQEFWVAIDQHVFGPKNSVQTFVCPDNHDGGEGDKVCPLCQLSRDLYKSGDPKHLDLAKELSTRRRIFVNALAEPFDQHLEGEGGPWSYVWAFSQSVLSGLMDICVAKRAFIDDPDDGRDVMLTCKRIGSQNRDIRYSVTDMDPSALPEDLRVMIKGDSLEDLAKPATLDDLHEAAAQQDPRAAGKRTSPIQHTTQTVNTPAPPAPRAPAPAPAPAPPSSPVVGGGVPDGTLYHYTGSGGDDKDGLSVSAIVDLMATGDQHFVWAEGMGEWSPADSVADIKDEIARRAAPPKPSKPVPPTRPSVGPPMPPKPPGGGAF